MAKVLGSGPHGTEKVQDEVNGPPAESRICDSARSTDYYVCKVIVRKVRYAIPVNTMIKSKYVSIMI